MNATEIDFRSAYRVAGWEGMAWNVVGYATYWTEDNWTFVGGPEDDANTDEQFYVYDEPEEVEDRTRVRCYMVGDDAIFIHDIEDLTPLPEEEFCPGCGQIGCGAYS